ncbi:MAG: NACHT domain-containing protein [Cyanobacteria bacterium P01_B01_bin.77]
MPASLPTEFLRKVAKQYKLTEFEKDAFVARLSNMDKTDLIVAKILNISRDRYSSRMTGVYRKFNIAGKGAGKANTLFFKVLPIYEKDDPYQSYGLENSALEKLVWDTQNKIQPMLEAKCAVMRILDMSNPISINDIFTEVKIRDQIRSNRHIDISELFDDDQDFFDPSSVKHQIEEKSSEEKIFGVDVINQHQRLMILGKPGAGKTTFLKHIALLLSNQSESFSNYIPAFVSLSDFCAGDENRDLKDYIFNDFLDYGVEANDLEILASKGRFIFLLDGLDEVKESQLSHVIRQIRTLDQSFKTNKFIITCRLAAQAQEYKFENFIEVEICDFNQGQIHTFVNNWFTEKDQPKKAERFMMRIMKDAKIRELSTSPLLLTLLCIVFEDSGDFPINRSELYEEGVDVLLRKWDANRDIYRPQVYKELSRNKKEDLLSDIAFNSFERNEYFFKQKSIEYEIRDYIYNLPKASQTPTNIDIDCREILRSIEANHGLIIEVAKGIYSFSHLTFHEYFVSRKIVKIMDPDEQRQVLNSLTSHIYEPRWREIFLLVSSMLPKADFFMKLMKAEIDSAVKGNTNLDKFFSWLAAKSCSAAGPGELIKLKSAGQILYFQLATRHHDLKGAKHIENREFKLDSDLSIVLSQSLVVYENIELSQGLLSSNSSAEFLKKIRADQNFVASTLDSCIEQVFESQLKKELHTLRQELNPDTASLRWWLEQGRSWIVRLTSTMKRFRDIGHDWNFTQEERVLLERYFYGSKLLENCLNKVCYVKRELRDLLHKNILLPIQPGLL